MSYSPSMSYSVVASSRFRPQARTLAKQHPKDFPGLFDLALEILRVDPLGTSRRSRVLKLTRIAPGKGQYRLRLRRYRFRYDVRGRTVELLFCGLRREDTYK